MIVNEKHTLSTSRNRQLNFFSFTVGARTFTTSVVKETLEPVWNQHFEVGHSVLLIAVFFSHCLVISIGFLFSTYLRIRSHLTHYTQHLR